jgi:predicted ATPase
LTCWFIPSVCPHTYHRVLDHTVTGADNQSQDIIQALVLDSEIKNVLIVCTYRNTEEGERIRQHICGGTEDLEGLCMSEIELGNLAPDAAMSMLRDVLCSGEDDVQSLCAFITQKTASNPYFICQFLELLQSRRLLKYSSKLSVWQFDLLKIQSEMDSSENVVDIVFERISCLGPLVQGVLQLASCLGHKFDGVLLEAIVFSELDNPGEESWLTTNPALMGEHSSTEYRAIMATAMKKGLIDTIGESGQYKFTHDR